MHKSPSRNEGGPCSPVGSSTAAVRRTALQLSLGSGEGLSTTRTAIQPRGESKLAKSAWFDLQVQSKRG